ncbi:hypothetical protein DXG03_001225 [Asterophora parasitica]|uniref:Nucleotide exchange factor Fes1 domain-containing protein n=1 Tax=Asterophora parasitica TaxID=117018 RepID=A0A9P7G4A5_9AGAR|nr:hypothetical protein DXG03_001225 [Asterophora parasitica]
MQSLLRWSIENSAQDGTTGSEPVVRKDLDPGVIDMILGRPDAELMKEDVALATDDTKSEDERVAALDHLEMLIESIDNANDLVKLKLWEPLHALLTAPSSTLGIKMQTLWVIGTALQNNPSAQDSYLALNPLPTLVSFLTPSPSSTLQTRSKAIYTLSGLLKHNAPAVRALDDPNVDGWARLRDALADPEITVRRKTIFLLNSLLLPTDPSLSSSSASAPSNLHGHAADPSQPVHDNSHAAYIHNPNRASTTELTAFALLTHRILEAVVQALTNPLPFGEDGDIVEPDATFEETGVRYAFEDFFLTSNSLTDVSNLRLLHTYTVLCKAALPDQEKTTVREWVASEKTKEGGKKQLAERWGLDTTELGELLTQLV